MGIDFVQGYIFCKLSSIVDLKLEFSGDLPFDRTFTAT